MNTSCRSHTKYGISFLSLKNPSIYLSIVLVVLFFVSLIKSLSTVYLGPFALMTWLSFFMCIGAPILIGGLFILLQPKWDARYGESRETVCADEGKEG
jgi:hypothetical protein